MEYTVNQLYQYLFEKPLNIYDIFKEFFGEDFVDMQSKNPSSIKEYLFAKICDEEFLAKGSKEEDFNLPFEVSDAQLEELEATSENKRFFIYVWWSRVTVTNEYDRSVNIQDLYAKIEIQNDGCIPYECAGFLLNRATYTREQFVSNYLHSHIRAIPKNDFTKFMEPCLGTGPIRNTIATLKNTYDETTWMLFCQELSVYVTVESIMGGPWRRMENIGDTSIDHSYLGYDFSSARKTNFLELFSDGDLKDFIQYYLKHGHLSLRYINEKYTWGMPYYEYIIDISNVFIDYYNEFWSTTSRKLHNCFEKGILRQFVIANGKFYKEGTGNSYVSPLDSYQDKLVLTFKGKEIHTHIIDVTQESEASLTTIIQNDIAMYILQNILRTINFRYKNEHNTKYRRNQEVTPACERVIYL